MPLLQELRTFDFFDQFADETLLSIMAHTEFATMLPGEVVFQEGRVVASLCFLLQGTVRAKRGSMAMRKQTRLAQARSSMRVRESSLPSNVGRLSSALSASKFAREYVDDARRRFLSPASAAIMPRNGLRRRRRAYSGDVQARSKRAVGAR